ncbi:MAG TPA: M28 family peptidase [Hymenobacter sp.]|jgi:hypothetical protein|uniref:M28 family peptidase n=1 Tax=Hymenobacter sp. TaxID=1898978 RepID=UPI002ED7CC7F
MMPISARVPPAPRRSYAALPLLWAAVVLVLTLTPANEMPRTPVWELLSFDTAAHAGVFAVLAGLSWFSLRRQQRWPRVARYVGTVALLGSILFGGLIEVLQQTMGLGRHGDWTDLLGDGIGAALVVGAATLWSFQKARRVQRLASVCGLTAMLVGTAPSGQAQDMARARQTIEKLAAPEMHGRGYVQQGEHAAAAYLRTRFREWKLEPLAPAYTQSFMLDVNTFPGDVKLRVFPPNKSNKNSFSLKPGADFIVAPGAPSLPQRVYHVVRADTLALNNSAAQAAAVLSGDADSLPREVLLLRQRDEKKLQQPENAGLLARWEATYAARIVLVDKLTSSVESSQARQPRLEVLASKWPVAPAGQPTYDDVELQIDAQLQRNYQTQNLAAVIRGSTQPDSFLVVSAHYDHLGTMGKDVYFPGANDNASGVALLLELAAHYAKPENRPACSVVFLLFGAEEAGLVGSSYFVQHPLVPLSRIKFLFNLDLLGTGEQGATVVNGRVLEVPYQRLVALNEARQYLPALGARGPAANSDHYPFSQAGVPAFFLYTRGGSAAYHDVNDRPAALSLAGFAGAFGLVRDFLNRMGAAR